MSIWAALLGVVFTQCWLLTYTSTIFVGCLCKEDNIGSEVEKEPDDPSQVVSNVLESNPMWNFLYPCSLLKCILVGLKPIGSTTCECIV